MIYVYKMKKKFQIYDITKIDHLSTFIELRKNKKYENNVRKKIFIFEIMQTKK